MKADIQKILQWYQTNQRVLPWRRDTISAYEVWVSEVMLQQTQVSRVVLYYERFLKKFPTVRKLAKTDWEEFLPYYEGLGYYSRGRNMIETAKIIVRDFGGEFPKDKAVLIKLPGIGEYTASAILSFAHHEPMIAYDTNFRKIFGTRKRAQATFKKSGVCSHIFNSAVMDYASANRTPNRKQAKHTQGSPVHLYTGLPCVCVVLHENHKKYFSESKKKYAPFMMPKGVASREQIKKYFFERCGLRVSVRPPNKKGIVNVQVLSGKPSFAIYSKKDYDSYHDRLAKN